MDITFRPLDAEDVEVRVSRIGKSAIELLLYKTARVDMAMLDEVVGPMSWQRRHEFKDGKLYCSIGVKDDDGTWVWKEDVGTPSNMESDKGEASDAFKRAGFCWGIGRELYTAPKIWVKKDACKNIRQGKNGKEQCYDDFRVAELGVEDGRIVNLVIVNASNRNAVVYGNAPKKQRSEPESDVELSKRRMWTAIRKWAELHGRTPESVLEGVKKRPEWAEDAAFFESVAAEFEGDLP